MIKRTVAAGLLVGGISAVLLPASAAQAADMPFPPPNGDWTASDMLQQGTGEVFTAMGETVAPVGDTLAPATQAMPDLHAATQAVPDLETAAQAVPHVGGLKHAVPLQNPLGGLGLPQ
ncbi:hypothetical protein GCM10023205_32290 [Yinghuangia aomiensis]|uniref:Secreted protein n=1 Tax=Yinghuangia aomiensis TaxID=676205 RepID=A0ABP9HAE5_9ACTN